MIKVVNRLLTRIDQVERMQLVLAAAEELGHVPKDLDSSSDSSDSDIELSKEAMDRKRRKTMRKEQKRQQLPQEMQLHKARKKLLKIPNSCLYQINIPDISNNNNNKKDYGAVYQHLAGQGIIPIGILRGTLANLRVGPKGNQSPYVFTNPPKDTELFSCDRLFVLATTPQQLNQKLDVKDWLLNIQMQQQKLRPTTPTTAPGGASSTAVGSFFLGGGGLNFTLSDDAHAVLDITEKNYQQLDEKMQRITNDVEEKLSTVIGSLENIFTNDCNIVEPTDFKMCVYCSRRRFIPSADEMSVGSGESRSRRSPITEAVAGGSSGIIKHDSVQMEASTTLVSPHHITNTNEEKDNDDDDNEREDSSTKSGPLISAVSFPRKFSLSKNVAPIQEEPDSNPSADESEDENVNNEAAVFPSPKMSISILASPSNTSRATFDAINLSPIIENPSILPLPTLSGSNSAAVSVILHNAPSDKSDVITAPTNEDHETTELIELIEESNPTNNSNQSTLIEHQTIHHENITNDDNNTVRTFTSLNSLKTMDKVPGPKIADITPLPLDRIPRSLPPQVQLPMQQIPQSYQYPILGGRPSRNSNPNLNNNTFSPARTGDYIPSLLSRPILNGGSRSPSSRSTQQVFKKAPVTRKTIS